MRWQQGRRSDNVEDRRGMAMPGMKISGLGIIAVLLISLITRTNPLRLLALLTQGSSQTESPATTPGNAPSSEYDTQKDFASVILADTEDVWSQQFQEMNSSYQAPKLVLFSDQVQSACGLSSAAVGPFYCPMDSEVYLDLSFFQELDQRFGAPGDFAQAYVIAHEVGHHVQNLLGISDKVHRAEENARSQEEVNALSVRLELQADCFAGVWAKHAKNPLEDGDVDEGLNAAAAVGDDRLQKQAGGTVSPESWTHGSSQMRSTWFRKGLQSGSINSCDTFASSSL